MKSSQLSARGMIHTCLRGSREGVDLRQVFLIVGVEDQLAHPDGICQQQKDAAVERHPLAEAGIVVQVPRTPRPKKHRVNPTDALDLLVAIQLDDAWQDKHETHALKQSVNDVVQCALLSSSILSTCLSRYGVSYSWYVPSGLR